MLNKLYKKQ